MTSFAAAAMVERPDGKSIWTNSKRPSTTPPQRCRTARQVLVYQARRGRRG